MIFFFLFKIVCFKFVVKFFFSLYNQEILRSEEKSHDLALLILIFCSSHMRLQCFNIEYVYNTAFH